MCIIASRQCTDYACVSYAGAGEASLARGVCSIQAVMAPPCRRPRPLSSLPKNAYLSSAYLNVSDFVTHTWLIPSYGM